MSLNKNNKTIQDWEEVVFNKPKSIEKQIMEGKLVKEIVEKKGMSKNKQSSSTNVKKLDETEIGHHKTPSHNLSMLIQKARLSKKMTQISLDSMCNFSKGTVASYENGKAIIDCNQLQVMSRCLNIALNKNI
jgi:ribosome-binding protein aMBF1 (putative translation factor)